MYPAALQKPNIAVTGTNHIICFGVDCCALSWLDHRAYPYEMNEKSRLVVLDDDQWAVLGPLIDECRPRGKTEPVALRDTIEAIVWRHQNGMKWRSVPADLVPWWRVA